MRQGRDVRLGLHTGARLQRRRAGGFKSGVVEQFYFEPTAGFLAA
jgi:hypothetical protein